ncbi:hypothetical protein NAE50_002211 [Salmonella enterica]|nr:hypothetical protein [Salmonella enterica]ELX2841844.1 hypothetical protein [Salmonella enterica]
MSNFHSNEYWLVHEAIAVSYSAFVELFGKDLLPNSLETMTMYRSEVLDQQIDMERDIDSFLHYPLNDDSFNVDEWLTAPGGEDFKLSLLIHVGVRWWRARDSMFLLPSKTLIPCLYVQGDTRPVKIQLLSQMLYRGASPDTISVVTPPSE